MSFHQKAHFYLTYIVESLNYYGIICTNLFLGVIYLFKQFNGVMLQCFEWYLPSDASLWKKLTRKAPDLAESGFTSVWLPPSYKCAAGIKSMSKHKATAFYAQNAIGRRAQKTLKMQKKTVPLRSL